MSSKTNRVFVVGVGMTKFEKPGKRDWDYPDMAKEAGEKALADAGIPYSTVEHAVVGYVYGDSTCGQRAVYGLGLTGIPIYNVNNNCSTGSTALLMAKQLVEGGVANCVMALGFEKMERGSLKNKYDDRTNPMDQHVMAMLKTREFAPAPVAPQMFGNAGREHMEKYATQKEHFAKIAVKNHKHSQLNPYAQFRKYFSLEQVLSSPPVYDPLTRLQCCPTSDGAGAAILCNEEFVHRHGLESQAVEIIGMAMATDGKDAFEGSCVSMVGAGETGMSARAAKAALQQAGVTPADVQVIELHDCFSCNELITYEALGLCGPGEAGKLIDAGDVTYGGRWVVNPSGGLISKGHPLGATGLAQCSELSWQLRQMCGERQVPGAKIALQHNIGLGGAAVVTIYRHGFPEAIRPLPAGAPNPAVDASAIARHIRPAVCPASASASGFASDALFAEIREGIKADPSVVKRVNGIYQFVVGSGPEGGEKVWTVDLKNGDGSVTEGKPSKADCTIQIADADFVAMAAGKANGQQLFMQGKLKISGNMAMAMKLDSILKKKGPAAQATAGEAFQSDAVFPEVAAGIKADPSLVKKVNGVYLFKIAGKDGASKAWTVDLKNGEGSVQEGEHGKADCVVSISDDDVIGMVTGKANGQQLFMQGKLKISGNMALAMKLQMVFKTKAKL
mmetsp:Transcript_40861/g.102901  ORF Transcript_40861/g.102901 Transcript_40861/m.102901 type:complete len:675 (-) Transcript_40861:59-2083(-)|eukprot:CAMPEP_0174244036 /NCGR_PEP_ID=MMETSP0417-20130205/33733_1 /TAXON_ID=242541 /ORGANISM="Mayorella sp, Strain BSH-02190019" /LENGTH=674 /DNA_ID=CAMNT_0015323655 /DNA_START=39 /DNA_END=2063 /DNA_ORIENTATION=+